FPDLQAAPLLCAGTIGFRALRMTGDATRLGLYGFGGAAHILTQIAIAEGRRVFAFTRRGDTATQAFARELGASWAGSSTETPPEPLAAGIVPLITFAATVRPDRVHLQVAHRQPTRELDRGQGPRDVVALGLVATELGQPVERRQVFDALGDDPQTQVPAEVHRGSNDHEVVRVDVHLHHEGAIHLDLFDRQPLEVR